jgi:hypothetical protein
LKTFSTMNIDDDFRLILCFIDTATHYQLRKITFYTACEQNRNSKE